MKKILKTITLLFAISSSAFAQKTILKGDLKGLEDGKIIFHYYLNDAIKSDTVLTTGGKFQWISDLSEPQKVGVSLPKQLLFIYASPGNISINGSMETPQSIVIKGSALQDEANAYQNSMKDLNDRLNQLYRKFSEVPKEERLVLEEELKKIGAEKRENDKKYITEHPKSYLSFDLVEQRMAGSYESVKPLFDLLDPSLKNSNRGKQLAGQLAVLKRSLIGEKALDFTQPDPNGKLIRFADFRGKYVLIDFWASWCAPCRAENPNVLKEYNKYKDKNFTVIGVSLDDKADRWKKAIEEDKLPWTQVSDLKRYNNELASYYGIRGIPSTLLVGPDGKIIAKDLRGQMLVKKLEEIFK